MANGQQFVFFYNQLIFSVTLQTYWLGVRNEETENDFKTETQMKNIQTQKSFPLFSELWLSLIFLPSANLGWTALEGKMYVNLKCKILKTQLYLVTKTSCWSEKCI